MNTTKDKPADERKPATISGSVGQHPTNLSDIEKLKIQHEAAKVAASARVSALSSVLRRLTVS